MARALTSIALALLIASCSLAPASEPQDEFEAWLVASPARAQEFQRFEAMLERDGVSGVVPNRELWLTDRLNPECVVEPYTMPPEEFWPRIVPALRYIRDYVKPAVGDVSVASAYRDEAFNACVRGATRSAHRGFYALDLVPRDAGMTRERLIEILCPIHAQDGARFSIGMGIYSARRFHIDAHGYRGWGEDFHAATFPCARDGG